MKRGHKVVHFLVVMEAQRKWIGAYLTWLSSRRYPTTFPNHPQQLAPAIIREIRFYDISVPNGSVNNLLGGLAPYNVPDSYLGKKFNFWANILRKLLGLKAPPVMNDNSSVLTDPYKKDLTVLVVGSKEDNWQNGNMELL